MNLERLVAHFTRTVDLGAPPIVEAVFHVSKPRWKHLDQAHIGVPVPFNGLALLDTGASVSCLDPAVVNHLRLEERGIADVWTPSTGPKPHPAPEYDVAIVIPPGRRGDAPLVIDCLPVIESDLFSKQGMHALIGRDVLQHCIFHYNGSGHFSLAW